jgi:hypothetical protein
MQIKNCGRKIGLIALTLWGATACVQAENTAAVNEVLKLKDAAVNDETIVAYIQNKNVNYDLSADGIVKLRSQGVSSPVLNAMLSSGQGAAVAGPAPAAPQPAAAVPQPQPVSIPTPVLSQPQPVVSSTVTTVVTQPAANPDVAYFYQELSPYGHWILAEDGQWCWQPTVVVGAPDWRPYWDKGRWIWTDQGWYWSSEYTWGWAPFHYGRWELHPHHGWVWFPDRVWGPSWVAWRSGGDYCGWAPLPPGAVYDVSGGFFLYRGRRVEAGFDFGLGFAHFSFCMMREMGDPFRRHFHGGDQMRAVFGHTTIINNYTVHRTVVGGEARAAVFNHGVEPAKFSAAKGRPFEPMHIQDLNTPAPGRGHERMDAKDKKLEVYRPRIGGGNGGGPAGGPGGGHR